MTNEICDLDLIFAHFFFSSLHSFSAILYIYIVMFPALRVTCITTCCVYSINMKKRKKKLSCLIMQLYNFILNCILHLFDDKMIGWFIIARTCYDLFHFFFLLACLHLHLLCLLLERIRTCCKCDKLYV